MYFYCSKCHVYYFLLIQILACVGDCPYFDRLGKCFYPAHCYNPLLKNIHAIEHLTPLMEGPFDNSYSMCLFNPFAFDLHMEAPYHLALTPFRGVPTKP